MSCRHIKRKLVGLILFSFKLLLKYSTTELISVKQPIQNKRNSKYYVSRFITKNVILFGRREYKREKIQKPSQALLTNKKVNEKMKERKVKWAVRHFWPICLKLLTLLVESQYSGFHYPLHWRPFCSAGGVECQVNITNLTMYTAKEERPSF